MKNNLQFALSWFPTLLTASILTALGSGTLQVILKFILPDSGRIQCLTEYAILTVIICAALAAVSAKLGKELNRGAKPFSTGIPVFNMLVCGAVYIAIYILMKGRAWGILYIFPCEMFLVNGVLGAEGASSATVIEKSGFCLFQFIIYMAVSLVFYMSAKKRQENSEGTKKLRGEKKKTNNRFGIDIDI